MNNDAIPRTSLNGQWNGARGYTEHEMAQSAGDAWRVCATILYSLPLSDIHSS